MDTHLTYTFLLVWQPITTTVENKSSFKWNPFFKRIFRYAILKRNKQIPSVFSLWFSERTTYTKENFFSQTSRTHHVIYHSTAIVLSTAHGPTSLLLYRKTDSYMHSCLYHYIIYINTRKLNIIGMTAPAFIPNNLAKFIIDYNWS